MAVYTLVVHTTDEVSQDALIKRVDGGPIAVVFCGPGALVDTGDDPEQEVTRTLEMAGVGAQVTLSISEDGPVLRLRGVGCDLDGEMPGEYYLVPHGAGALGD